MPSPEVYESVKNAISLLGGFFLNVSKEIGKERAIDLYSRSGEAFGRAYAEAMKRHSGEADASKKVADELNKLLAGFGFTADFETETKKITARSHKCPLYDGFRSAGLDHDTIEELCQKSVAVENSIVKELVPGAQITLTEFRDSSKGSCCEEIVIPS